MLNDLVFLFGPGLAGAGSCFFDSFIEQPFKREDQFTI